MTGIYRLQHSFRIEPQPSFREADRLYRTGQKDEAFTTCQAVLTRHPRHLDALHLSGVIRLDCGDHEAALVLLRQAAMINPDQARMQYHLGNALLGLQRFDEAEPHYRRAIALEPSMVDAWNNLGTVLSSLNRPEEAIVCFETVLREHPTLPQAHYNLGRALTRLGRAEEAVAHFARVTGLPQEAVELKRMLETRDALATALMMMGLHEEALATMRTRRRLDPDDPNGPWNESLLLLLMGRMREAWPLYEARWRLPGFRSGDDAAKPPPPVPSPGLLSGARVHLWAEQGRGDAVQFVRYAAMARALAAHVSLSVPADLVALMQSAPGVDRVVADDEPAPAHDVTIPLMSLPGLFGTEMGSIPAPVPYLAAPADRIDVWRKRLGGCRGRRVGLCWWGSQHIPDRSVKLALLASVLRVPRLQFHALQKEITPEDRPLLDQLTIVDHSAALSDFVETAALISLMDVVVTIDTSVAHLAGALGKPVWIMLHRTADWRWFLDREDSPWYPTARLFRQRTAADWHRVVGQVTAALANLD